MPGLNTYVAVLDVGHGNCTILKDNNNTTIVDCGPGSALLEFLTLENITHIDAIFLSHADQDHIEGILAVVNSQICQIDAIYVNGDSTKKSAVWTDMLFSLTRSGHNLNIGITRNSGPFQCGVLVLEVVGPSPYLAGKSAGGTNHNGKKITSNSLSSSFRVFWKNQPIAYLAGDIDEISLEDFNAFGYSPKAPLLVFPHHGGNAGGSNVEQFTEDLCDLVQPGTVVFSIGRTKHTNPRKDVVKKVREKISNVRIACTQLSKNCCTDIKVLAPHLNSFYARGRSANHCCGGTFIIELDQPNIIYAPDIKSHHAFIAAATTNPLCKVTL